MYCVRPVFSWCEDVVVGFELWRLVPVAVKSLIPTLARGVGAVACTGPSTVASSCLRFPHLSYLLPTLAGIIQRLIWKGFHPLVSLRTASVESPGKSCSSSSGSNVQLWLASQAGRVEMALGNVFALATCATSTLMKSWLCWRLWTLRHCEVVGSWCLGRLWILWFFARELFDWFKVEKSHFF